MNVHFILTGGVLGPCERRAIISAAVHGEQIILWYTGDKPEVDGLDIQLERIEVPSWLHPRYLCHTFDVLAYQTAYEHGGLFLQLDTISIHPAWDLLGTCDVAVSTEWPADNPDVLTTPEKLAYPHQAMFLARKGSDAIGALYEEAKRRIIHEPEIWGYTGPYMLTDFVQNYSGVVGAPFPTLCGWAPGYIWRFYLGLETPGPDVRVIHLFRVAYLALYERRYADWARDNPYYAGSVACRTDANERLLRCP